MSKLIEFIMSAAPALKSKRRQKLQSDKLPSTGRVLQTMAICFAGYAALEILGIFTIKEWSPALKQLFNRGGIAVAYLGAIVVGLYPYWNAKAHRIAASTVQIRGKAESGNDLLIRLAKELGKNFDFQIEKNRSRIAHAIDELDGVSRYFKTRPWLGKLSLVCVVIGAYLQMLGST